MTLNRRLRIAVLERDGYRCIYCGRSSRETVLEVDHVIPRARGGVDLSINLVTACRDCNGGKSDDLRALPADYVPRPIGMIGRATVPAPTGGLPRDLRDVVDDCPACGTFHPGSVNCHPVVMVDGDAHRIRLAYRCGQGHQWQTWWATGYARIHAETVRWQRRRGLIETYTGAA